MAQLCRVQRRGEPGGVKVVQLLGGLNSFQNAEYRPDEIANRFAVMLGGTPYSLFIPAILNNVQLKDLIYAEEQFKPMLKMIDGIDVAVITAGLSGTTRRTF
jgi:DNA-binding transcriptional regulator LsrR (DeoR family)